MSAKNRTELIKLLKGREFDVIVIGGGITGSWTAFYLSKLNFRVLLLEKGDFASETSSASSKLLHGGIRYLQQLKFGKVRESSLERANYLFAAPHLASAVPFIIPSFSDIKRSSFVLKVAIAVYSVLGIGQHSKLKSAGISIPRYKPLSKNELLDICKISENNLTGAEIFPEYQMYDSERVVWSLLESTEQNGGSVLNYAEVTDILIDDKSACGVSVKCEDLADKININGKLIINAAGPWIENILQSKKEVGKNSKKVQNTNSPSPTSEDILFQEKIIHGYATGTHIVTKKIVEDYAIAVTTKQNSGAKVDRGGRHIFVIPWRNHSLIGTSYRETVDPNDASDLKEEDLHQLLDAVNSALPTANLQAQDIVSSYSGLYPLRTEQIKSSVYQGTGEYLIIDHKELDQIDGLITALGAKYTTGRVLAKKTIDLSITKLSKATINTARNKTKDIWKYKLESANYKDKDNLIERTYKKRSRDYDREQIAHFVKCYGSGTDYFLDFVESQPQNILPPLESRVLQDQPDTYGQVAWAVTAERAIHLQDVLLRRTSLGYLGIGDEQILKVATLMGSLLKWSEQQIEKEVSEVLFLRQKTRNYIDNFFAGSSALGKENP